MALSPHKNLYHFRTTEDSFREASVTTTEDGETEDDDQPTSKTQHWHQRLLKSASGVFHRDSGNSSPETTRQCVLSTTPKAAATNREAGSEDGHTDCCCDTTNNADLETSFSTSVSNNTNNILLSTQILMAMSIMLILHAMMTNF